MDEREPAVMMQTTITLPFLDDEVPALYLADGRPYIPVFAVCHALGISPASSIRRWRNLALWVTARKLPFQTRRQGKRLVWCLLISQVPFLYSLFDWKQVAPERRAQLRQATEAQVQLANRAYQTMQQRYKAMRPQCPCCRLSMRRTAGALSSIGASWQPGTLNWRRFGTRYTSEAAMRARDSGSRTVVKSPG